MTSTTETGRWRELPDDALCRLAQRYASSYLRRFDDALTRAEFDDLVQESAFAAWRWASAARQPERFAAAVRTIARRRRGRALAAQRRRLGEESAAAALQSRTRAPSMVRVGGRPVPHDWAVARLVRAMRRLRPIDRCLLLAFEEGFSTKEIAARYGLTVHNVKVRAHRARRRVREEIEAAAQDAVADGFET